MIMNGIVFCLRAVKSFEEDCGNTCLFKIQRPDEQTRKVLKRPGSMASPVFLKAVEADSSNGPAASNLLKLHNGV